VCPAVEGHARAAERGLSRNVNRTCLLESRSPILLVSRRSGA
jgi:hypothetical protein